MCGLVGMAGNITLEDRKAMRWLLEFDTIRGIDSTGLAVVTSKDGDIDVYKKEGLPHKLFESSAVFDDDGYYIGPNAKVFIGHNRAATKGIVNDQNAHPFLHEGVVGAHNGTLRSVSMLENGNKFAVDSEAIFYNLGKFSIESTIPCVDGAYALTWYDDSSEKVYVIRNYERPLHWCRRLDNDVIYWASEAWMLEIILTKLKIKHTEPVAFKADKLYQLDVSNVTPSVFRSVDWDDSVELKGYTPPPSKKITSSTSAFNNHKGGNGSNVIPFVGGGGGRSRAEVAIMKTMVETEIEFRFNTVKTGVSKSVYLSASPDNPASDWDIRVYGTNHRNWEEWQKKTHTTLFKGRIKKVIENNWKGKKETYFLIDLRSIVEVNEELPDSNTTSQDDFFKYFEGFQGRWLTYEEWTLCVKDGCACCSKSADPRDADLVFIEHDRFIGGCCIDSFPEYNPQKTYN